MLNSDRVQTGKSVNSYEEAYGYMDGRLGYVPVDVSESATREASFELIKKYTSLKVLGIIAKFTKQLYAIPSENNNLIFFSGALSVISMKEEVKFS